MLLFYFFRYNEDFICIILFFIDICEHRQVRRNLFEIKILVNERKLILVSKIAKFNETAQEISQRLFSSYYYNLYLFLPFIF